MSKKNPPTPKQFYNGLAKKRPAMLVCRSYGHAWAPYTVQQLGRTFEVTAQCGRCLTLRRETLSGTGLPLGDSHYVYPEGYEAPGVGQTLRGTRGTAKITLLQTTQSYSKIDPKEES